MGSGGDLNESATNMYVVSGAAAISGTVNEKKRGKKARISPLKLSGAPRITGRHNGAALKGADRGEGTHQFFYRWFMEVVSDESEENNARRQVPDNKTLLSTHTRQTGVRKT